MSAGPLRAFVLALACCVLLTPLVMRFALRHGALARPIARSVHKRPIPNIGGIAIFVAFVAAVVAFGDFGLSETRGILLGGAVIVAVGVIDDRFRLRPHVKLLGQIAAASILIPFGVTMEWLTNPFGGMIYLAGWGIPLTIGWVVTLVNVMNLADGLDGLAAGIASIASLTLLFVASGNGHAEMVLLAACLAGGTIGFLPYNFNPAKIFMGDAGSMFLGFTLAAISVEGALKTPTAVAVLVPVLALGVPIFDTSFAIVRRLAAGRPIHEADQEHLHHRLLRQGLSQRQVVGIMYLVTAGLCLSGIVMSHDRLWQGALLLSLVVLATVTAAGRTGLLAVNRPKHLDR